jgi:mannose-1-phosphate guanylyltransferase/phosphomannomutase
VRRQLPPAFHLEREVECPWDVKGEVMRLMVEARRGDIVDLTDGLKAERPGGYVLVLPDADAAQYRVISSGSDLGAVERGLDEFSKELEETVRRGA